MTYEVYRYIFIISAILCGIMLIVSVLLFILLKIPRIINDLSGRTAKKAIKNIREQNEASGEKFHKVSAFNESRGKLTDKISQSGQLQRKNTSMQFGIDTTKISTQNLSCEESETTVLFSGETSLLSETIENEINNLQGYDCTNVDVLFEIEQDITYIHTEEIIIAEAKE